MKLTLKNSGYIVLITLILQAVIIGYNYFSGFINVNSFGEFLFRLIFGTSFASLVAIYFFVADLKMLSYLNVNFAWSEKTFIRIILESLFSIIIGILGAVFITTLVQFISEYEQSFLLIILVNSLIGIVINIIFVVVLEAIYYYKRNQESRYHSEKLEKENAVIRLDVLKNQLNPHFLFNSLNVLSSLIKVDPDKAQEFIDEFASVYRYTLDVIDKTVVSLREEIDFATSFLYLQKIRFGNAVITELEIDNSLLDHLVPPLAIQTLLENAFKHNKVSSEKPLMIRIYSENNRLFVSNSYLPKLKSEHSSGIGLENLRKRYELICGEKPEFFLKDDKYISIIPLVKPD